jgi:ATP-binding cassette, subfamily B, bacterial IrtB/YbtQ
VESPYIGNGLEYEQGGGNIMLKVIKRVLRLSGDLSKRIYASFVFSFIDSIVAMFPVGAVFYTLTKIQNNKAFTGNDWLVIFGILLISLVVRMVFKYLVYSFQSTAGFEFVSRERITLGDKLRNVGMGFFHERNMGDITTTVTTDLNFLENYSMHILDRVITGMVNMVVISIFILMFDWRLGRIFRKTPAIPVRRTKAAGHDCCVHRCKIGYSCFGRADEWA